MAAAEYAALSISTAAPRQVPSVFAFRAPRHCLYRAHFQRWRLGRMRRDYLLKEVPFDFSITSMDSKSVEFGLNSNVKGNGMYVDFSMANAWETGRAGLVLKGISTRSNLNGMSAEKYLEDPKRKGKKTKDFSDFMKDKSGRSVSTYRFKQTLEEGKEGGNYMLIAYAGPAMEMIQTLEIPRPITLPAHISSLFTEKGIIQFKPGAVAFDSRSKGFHIPVEIR